VRFLACFISCCFTAFAGAAIDRDWVKNPAVVQIDTSADIFAIGDAHSDYARLAAAMHAAGLIAGVPQQPEDVKWSAGSAVLVVTGDMIDKGPGAIDVLRLLHSLQASALVKGGRVIVLAGNHEAEFLADPAAKKGEPFAAQLTAKGIRPSDVASCKSDIGEFLCSLPFAARVNDWFFSHAGNSGGRSLMQLAADLQKGVIKDGFATRQLIGDNSILESRLNEKDGRPWIDTGVPDQTEKQLLSANAEALGVRHIVQGHVPSRVKFADGAVREPGEMFQVFGMLFLIDTGMSEGVDNSRGAVLHITSKDATAICPDGKRTLLWDKDNQPGLGRAAPCRK
jgi:calcineurin-like phosphoesterase family protein